MKNKSVSKKKSTFKTLHKWPAIVISFIVIQFALSGIVMNHRSWFSKIEVSRSILPSKYRYDNWNQAAVKGGFPIGKDSILFYGNIGIYLKNVEQIVDLNEGFPTGIDNRKIYKVERYKDAYVAATHFGLYTSSVEEIKWIKVDLPSKEQRLSDLCLKQDTLVILSRSHLLKTSDLHNFTIHQLLQPEDYERKSKLFTFLWELHSGELFGTIGKFFVDILGIVTILLAISGLLHFLIPKRIKHKSRKKLSSTTLKSRFKINLKWHNVLGYVFVLFLLGNTCTGMFLRPPLLIPIASKTIGIVPGTHLDTPNAWYDKLRRIEWNKGLDSYLLSTSDGFYSTEAGLNRKLHRVKMQPPVSVMGCNVLEPLNDNAYLVGSFTGLYYWNIENGNVYHFITKQPYVNPGKPSRPVSDYMISGLVYSDSASWYFDYNSGMKALNDYPKWEMPQEVRYESPISLWNLCLEIHTGRIYEPLIGMFYILFVPIAGICVLLVLFSGFMLWWRKYRKKG